MEGAGVISKAVQPGLYYKAYPAIGSVQSMAVVVNVNVHI